MGMGWVQWWVFRPLQQGSIISFVADCYIRLLVIIQTTFLAMVFSLLILSQYL